MSKINIFREDEDEHSRYKMPKLETRIEGRGNGIKTILINIYEISKSLKRPVEYLTKFLGIELGSKCYYDKNKKEGIIMGSQHLTRLQDYIYKFIKIWVLCQNCNKNPETNLIFKKKDIKLECYACGKLNQCVVLDKVGNFILNNKDLYNKISKQTYKDSNIDTNSLEVQDSYEQDQSLLNLKNLISIEIKKIIENNLDDVQKVIQIKHIMKNNNLTYDDILGFIISNIADNNLVNQLKKHKVILQTFYKSSLNKNKSQKFILYQVCDICIESLKVNENVLKKIPEILYLFYQDLDMLDEDIIIEWYKKRSKEKNIILIKEKLDKFIEWLQTTEENSEEEDSEEEEDSKEEDFEEECSQEQNSYDANSEGKSNTALEQNS